MGKFTSRRLGTAALFIGLGCLASSARGGLLDPASFTSLGTYKSSAGSYSVTTSGTPTISDGAHTYTGVISNGVAVFTFDSIILQSGTNLSGSGPLPVALLSKGALTIESSANINFDGRSFGANFTPPGPGGGAGGTGGVGGTYNSATGRNTNGGPGSSGSGPGGGAGGAGDVGYSDSRSYVLPGGGGGGVFATSDFRYGPLVGGSGGGGSGGSESNPGRDGIQGGGAIELGALGLVTLSGQINTNGGQGYNYSVGNASGGGGGSGGGVLVHGDRVLLSGKILANGGQGIGSNFVAGGGGSGGLIEILYNQPGGYSASSSTVLSVLGGVRGNGNGGTDGANGNIIIAQAQGVPEPASLAMLGMAVVLMMAFAPRLRRGKGGTNPAC